MNKFLIYIKNNLWWILIVFAIIVSITIFLALKYKKEYYGYEQNINRNYSDLTFQDWENESTEMPGQMETASDMPYASSGYVSSDVGNL